MKSIRLLLLVIAILTLSPTSLAQESAQLPGELNQNSKLREVLEWLDKTSFDKAIVTLHDVYLDYSSATADDGTGMRILSASALLGPNDAYFSRGFKLGNVPGCNVTLRNDDVQALVPESDYPTQDFAPYVAELYIPLHKLDAGKGKGPHRHTSNPDRARIIGTWRTEFRPRGFFNPKRVFGLAIFPPNRRELREYLDSTTLSFTFDDKVTSEKFNAAFRLAIRFCKPLAN
jgi:hypothetical protein